MTAANATPEINDKRIISSLDFLMRPEELRCWQSSTVFGNGCQLRSLEILHKWKKIWRIFKN
jgi:hypothetical protein